MSLKKSIYLIVIILLIDQISKVYIKTHFALQESIEVFTWFKIFFIENDGMAWGTKISDFVSFINDRTAKVALTMFRVIAIFGIGYWLYDAAKKQSPKVLILAIGAPTMDYKRKSMGTWRRHTKTREVRFPSLIDFQSSNGQLLESQRSKQ